MKRIAAWMLRRLADRLHPIQASPKVVVSYNGQPVDAMVTALTRHVRQNGLRGIV